VFDIKELAKEPETSTDFFEQSGIFLMVSGNIGYSYTFGDKTNKQLCHLPWAVGFVWGDMRSVQEFSGVMHGVSGYISLGSKVQKKIADNVLSFFNFGLGTSSPSSKIALMAAKLISSGLYVRYGGISLPKDDKDSEERTLKVLMLGQVRNVGPLPVANARYNINYIFDQSQLPGLEILKDPAAFFSKRLTPEEKKKLLSDLNNADLKD
jgi:hypothetical protein